MLEVLEFGDFVRFYDFSGACHSGIFLGKAWTQEGVAKIQDTKTTESVLIPECLIYGYTKKSK